LRANFQSWEVAVTNHEPGNGDVPVRPSVEDYHSLLARAVSALKPDTPEAGQELYERARTALKAEFGKLDPPPSDAEILQEGFKLDFAIHDFESSMNEMGDRS
jgi:hypothetical protein